MNRQQYRTKSTQRKYSKIKINRKIKINHSDVCPPLRSPKNIFSLSRSLLLIRERHLLRSSVSFSHSSMSTFKLFKSCKRLCIVALFDQRYICQRPTHCTVDHTQIMTKLAKLLIYIDV